MRRRLSNHVDFRRLDTYQHQLLDEYSIPSDGWYPRTVIRAMGRNRPASGERRHGVKDPDAEQRDIEHLLDATGGDASHCFMSAASPGVVSVFFRNDYYPTREDYLSALVDFDPSTRRSWRLGSSFSSIARIWAWVAMQFSRASDDEFLREAELNVEALNAAVWGIPSDRLRMDVCWGNYEGPHHKDIALSRLSTSSCGRLPQGSRWKHPTHAMHMSGPCSSLLTLPRTNTSFLA